MNKRINIILPENTLSVLDRVAAKGNRSSFISKAVTYYIQTQTRRSLRERLKSGYEANAEEDLKMAAEWFPLEEEAWRKFKKTQKKSRKN